jgi:hypothetical protein
MADDTAAVVMPSPLAVPQPPGVLMPVLLTNERRALNAARMMRLRCAWCSKTPRRRLVCAWCCIPAYCNEECQLGHWEHEHERECRFFRQLRVVPCSIAPVVVGRFVFGMVPAGTLGMRTVDDAARGPDGEGAVYSFSVLTVDGFLQPRLRMRRGRRYWLDSRALFPCTLVYATCSPRGGYGYDLHAQPPTRPAIDAQLDPDALPSGMYIVELGMVELDCADPAVWARRDDLHYQSTGDACIGGRIEIVES